MRILCNRIGATSKHALRELAEPLSPAAPIQIDPARARQVERRRSKSRTLLLIGRDFSSLTLTSGKPWALNSSVNRSFVTFVVFFTSN
jgi:hypothetical protein